jgi:hypothetical protein
MTRRIVNNKKGVVKGVSDLLISYQTDTPHELVASFQECKHCPQMYELHIHAFSHLVSRGYTDQQNSQPVNLKRFYDVTQASILTSGLTMRIVL